MLCHLLAEFWRRAAMARMSLGAGSSSSGGSPPGFPGGAGGGHAGGGAGGSSSTSSPSSGQAEPTRRQRSVYSSSQVTSLIRISTSFKVIIEVFSDRAAGGLLQLQRVHRRRAQAAALAPHQDPGAADQGLVPEPKAEEEAGAGGAAAGHAGAGAPQAAAEAAATAARG